MTWKSWTKDRQTTNERTVGSSFLLDDEFTLLSMSMLVRELSSYRWSSVSVFWFFWQWKHMVQADSVVSVITSDVISWVEPQKLEVMFFFSICRLWLCSFVPFSLGISSTCSATSFSVGFTSTSPQDSKSSETLLFSNETGVVTGVVLLIRLSLSQQNSITKQNQ